MGDPHPSFGWVHRPFLKTGARWTSGAVGISPHTGGWHAAADKLRRWLRTWWQAPELPARLKRAIGFYNVIFQDWSGIELRPPQTMPAIARYAKAHGIEHFLVWDMPLLGMYVRAGSAGLFEDKPERRAALRRALDEVKAMGVTVSPLINLRLGNQHHAFWKEKGRRWAMRTQYGLPVQETLPLRRNAGAWIVPYLDQGGVRFCQANPEFQEWALECTRTVLDLGFNAIFLDQPFSEDYCFSDEHGHPAPQAGHEGVCGWIPRAAEIATATVRIRTSSAKCRTSGTPSISTCGGYWDWSGLCPEVFRYVLPESRQSWVIDAFDHQDQVGRAFALGFMLNINVRSLERTLEDVPEFADRVAKLAALHRKTAEFTILGRFMNRLGLTVETAAEVTVARYDAGDRVGIVLGEGSRCSTGGGAVRLALSPEALQGRTAGPVTLHRQDGSSTELDFRVDGGNTIVELELGRWECAVIEMDCGPKGT